MLLNVVVLKYNVCLQNAVEWKYEVAQSGKVQIPENCTIVQ